MKAGRRVVLDAEDIHDFSPQFRSELGTSVRCQNTRDTKVFDPVVVKVFGESLRVGCLPMLRHGNGLSPAGPTIDDGEQCVLAFAGRIERDNVHVDVRESLRGFGQMLQRALGVPVDFVPLAFRTGLAPSHDLFSHVGPVVGSLDDSERSLFPWV